MSRPEAFPILPPSPARNPRPMLGPPQEAQIYKDKTQKPDFAEHIEIKPPQDRVSKLREERPFVETRVPQNRVTKSWQRPTADHPAHNGDNKIEGREPPPGGYASPQDIPLIADEKVLYPHILNPDDTLFVERRDKGDAGSAGFVDYNFEPLCPISLLPINANVSDATVDLDLPAFALDPAIPVDASLESPSPNALNLATEGTPPTQLPLISTGDLDPSLLPVQPVLESKLIETPLFAPAPKLADEAARYEGDDAEDQLALPVQSATTKMSAFELSAKFKLAADLSGDVLPFNPTDNLASKSAEAPEKTNILPETASEMAQVKAFAEKIEKPDAPAQKSEHSGLQLGHAIAKTEASQTAPHQPGLQLQHNPAQQNIQPAERGLVEMALRVPIALERVPFEITSSVHKGEREFSIRLDPPELGRVDVTVSVDKNGKVGTHLVVERSETLDQLRRDAPNLERALTNSGLKTDSGSMQFSLRDQNAQNFTQHQQYNGHARRGTIEVELADINGWQPAQTASLGQARGRGLDLKI